MTYRLHADPRRPPPASCSNCRSSTARPFLSTNPGRDTHRAAHDGGARKSTADARPVHLLSWAARPRRSDRLRTNTALSVPKPSLFPSDASSPPLRVGCARSEHSLRGGRPFLGGPRGSFMSAFPSSKSQAQRGDSRRLLSTRGGVESPPMIFREWSKTWIT